MEGKQAASVAGALLLGIVAAFGAGKVMGDGTTHTLVAFTCHAVAKQCTAEFRVTKDGDFVADRQVRFSFDGKVKNEQGKEMDGAIPKELTDCVAAFKGGKFDDSAELEKK